MPPNVELYKTSHVTIDQTAPVTVVNGADTAWHNTPVTLNFASTDVGAGVDYIEFSLDGGSHWTQGNAATISSNGVTTVKYRAVDLAQPSGNVEATHSVDVKVDQIAPTTIDNYDGAWHSGDVTVTLSPTDTGGSGLASTMYKIDGGAWTSGTSVLVTAAGHTARRPSATTRPIMPATWRRLTPSR